MIVLTPIALIGLVLIPLIMVLHFRRRRYTPYEVPSLLIWRDVLGDAVASDGRFSVLFSWLLLLQLLAVALLVLSLARPQGIPGPQQQEIVVLDDSYRMAATDVLPTRMAGAVQEIDRQIMRAAPSTLFTVIVASAEPYVLITSTDRAQVQRRLATVTPSMSQANLAAGLRLAAGSSVDPGTHPASVLVVYARGDVLPPVSGTSGTFATLSVGRSSHNIAVGRLSVRCTLATRATCMAYAAVRNEGGHPVTAPVVIDGDGAVLAEPSLHLPADSVTGLSFPVAADTHTVRVYSASPDLLPLDNVAWSIVPSVPRVRVLLVGAPASTTPLQEALAALPGVAVDPITPARYLQARPVASAVVILDGWLPAGSLPAVPALLLINPPRLPGGSVGSPLADTTVSGSDPGSGLLAGVDLTSLDINAGAARSLTLPPGVSPVVWSAAGPLLAAGSFDGRQLTVFSFDPIRSDLPQLGAFPVLLQNILQWSVDWLPTSARAGSALTLLTPPRTSILRVTRSGMPGAPGVRETLHPASGIPAILAVPQPGLYTITEQGPWGTRTGQVAVNLGSTPTLGAATLPIFFGSPAIASNLSAPVAAHSWWPWIGLIALLLIVAEWLYVVAHQEGA